MRTKILVALLATFALAGIGMGAFLLAAGRPAPVAYHAPVSAPIEPPSAETVAAERAAILPTTIDFRLTVRITKQDCFGSAGCNVEYQIHAALNNAVPAAECDVTYRVGGLDDRQIGTLTTHADGTYDQDSYQAGSTAHEGRKLTATVTAVDCS